MKKITIKHTSVVRWALLVALAAIIASCTSTPTNDMSSLERSEWLAVSVEGHTANDWTSSTLEFPDANSVKGSTACNQFNAKVKFDGKKIELGSIGSTERFCGKRDDELQKAYLEALGMVKTWEIEANTLRLMDAGGKILIKLKRLGTSF